MRSIIVSPSLESSRNVSGVSAVTTFIIANNGSCEYIHFEQGKSDEERGGLHRLTRVFTAYKKWIHTLQENPDAIVHYNFPLDAFSIVRDYFFMRRSVVEGRRTIIHIHGGLFLFKDKKPFFLKLLLEKIFSWDVPFIVLSEKEEKRLKQEFNPKQVFVLPNCIDLREASEFERKEYAETMHILFLGRIEPNKGIDDIFSSFVKLKAEINNFVLHFAGKEQGVFHYVDKFTELLGDKFVYEGVVSGGQKVKLLEVCDVFLLPSYYEGLPMSLLECMSYGMVPITTNVGSISDFVEDGRTGLFVEKRAPETITTAIKLLYGDCELRKRLSTGARKKIFSTLNVESYIAKLNVIYQSC